MVNAMPVKKGKGIWRLINITEAEMRRSGEKMKDVSQSRGWGSFLVVFYLSSSKSAVCKVDKENMPWHWCLGGILTILLWKWTILKRNLIFDVITKPCEPLRSNRLWSNSFDPIQHDLLQAKWGLIYTTVQLGTIKLCLQLSNPSMTSHFHVLYNNIQMTLYLVSW